METFVLKDNVLGVDMEYVASNLPLAKKGDKIVLLRSYFDGIHRPGTIFTVSKECTKNKGDVFCTEAVSRTNAEGLIKLDQYNVLQKTSTVHISNSRYLLRKLPASLGDLIVYHDSDGAIQSPVCTVTHFSEGNNKHSGGGAEVSEVDFPIIGELSEAEKWRYYVLTPLDPLHGGVIPYKEVLKEAVIRAEQKEQQIKDIETLLTILNEEGTDYGLKLKEIAHRNGFTFEEDGSLTRRIEEVIH
ncbi:hypothetical protein ACH2FV_19660 (plasmid) [Bacillus safensis subsp. safensis]|uniref:hypothetical protein n=1 Tax=Bacillus safensis TaxID=561879 RepID=UPI0037BF004A